MTRVLDRSYPSMLALAVLAVLVAACVRPMEPTAPVPPPPPLTDLNLVGAASALAADLERQMSPGLTRSMVIDPLLDSRTGQQTVATTRVQQELIQAFVAKISQATILKFDGAGAGQARLLVSGTLTALPDANRFRMTVALSDRHSGIVVAQAATQFVEAGMDPTPTRFYADSPSLVRDRSVEGHMKTAETPAGQAADTLYMEQVPTSALLADALEAYNAERWSDSLALYNTAVLRPDGQQLRTFNGIYLANVQLGQLAAAEEAFSKIAALGLATNNLAVKLLFKPGATEFWPDPKVSGVYPMWLKQIAKVALASGSCLNVVGHTSASGTEGFNEKLSLARAGAIRERLEREAPGIARKSQVSGVGSRENLVGTGTDDASDAIDRRVEFKVVACTP